MPIYSPVSIQICATILITAHGNVVRIHILSLINNFAFVNILLLNIFGSIWIYDRNKEELTLTKHLLIIFIALNNTLMNHFQKHEQWCLR